jgi:fumarate hydratase class II
MPAEQPLEIQNLSIGLTATGTRPEFDSMGTIDVPADKYYGAQTARSLVHFSIGDDRMPKAVYHAYGIVKKACALVNQAEGRLPAAGVESAGDHSRCRRNHRRPA